MAYEDGLIDSLVGKAKKDYEAWLKEDTQVASEIDKYVRNKLAEGGFKAVHVPKPEDQGDVDDHTDNWNDDDNIEPHPILPDAEDDDTSDVKDPDDIPRPSNPSAWWKYKESDWET